jgi:hypothetical protein
MKLLRKIKMEQVWITCIIVGPILAFLAVYYPALSVIAILFIIIGLRGILTHIM